MVRSAEFTMRLKHFNNGEAAVPMRSGSFSTTATAFSARNDRRLKVSVTCFCASTVTEAWPQQQHSQSVLPSDDLQPTGSDHIRPTSTGHHDDDEEANRPAIWQLFSSQHRRRSSLTTPSVPTVPDAVEEASDDELVGSRRSDMDHVQPATTEPVRPDWRELFRHRQSTSDGHPPASN